MEEDTRQAWRRLVGRCTRPGYDGYHGAPICGRWLSYDAFLEDMGRRPSKWHRLGRVDKARAFEPGNVGWVEDGIPFEGTRLTVAEWASRLGLEKNTLWMRLKKRWPVERAFSKPVRGSRRGIHARSMWALRVDGEADGVTFEKQLSNPYGNMMEAVMAWRALVSRCLEKGYKCKLELMRRSPEEDDWVRVISYP